MGRRCDRVAGFIDEIELGEFDDDFSRVRVGKFV